MGDGSEGGLHPESVSYPVVVGQNSQVWRERSARAQTAACSFCPSSAVIFDLWALALLLFPALSVYALPV